MAEREFTDKLRPLRSGLLTYNTVTFAQTNMNRRQFIAIAGTTTTVALAGCLGGDDDTDSPEAVVEAYAEEIGDDPEEGDLDDFPPSRLPTRLGRFRV